MTTPTYPLSWPRGWPRTKTREISRFDTSFQKAAKDLLHEIALMGGKYVVISSNVPLRQDGLPYASYRQPIDPGVAVYFTRKDKPLVFACDRWTLVQDNLRAIGKTIQAVRGMELWGASEIMDRAFDGFVALPSPKMAWDILGVAPHADLDTVNVAYRKMARQYHPDMGGNIEQMVELNAARDTMLDMIEERA